MEQNDSKSKVLLFWFHGTPKEDWSAWKQALEKIPIESDGTRIVLFSPSVSQEESFKELVQDTITQGFEVTRSAYYSLFSDFLKQADGNEELQNALEELIVEGEWTLEDANENSIDYLNDQLLSLLPFCLTQIAQSIRSDFQHLDIRDVLVTDDIYGNATIDREASQRKWSRHTINVKNGHFLLQGGTGISIENQNTRLKNDVWSSLFFLIDQFSEASIHYYPSPLFIETALNPETFREQLYRSVWKDWSKITKSDSNTHLTLIPLK